jgi:hypothetical protein
MKLIASCGLICNQCPAYIATHKNDRKLREETAEKWSAMYNAEIKAEDIRCEGCHSKNGIVFFYCNDCKIRACCQEKEFSNCSECYQYPCVHLQEFFQFVPEAKETLESL